MVAKVERQYNSFVKGLITEATPLNFPENASIDEANLVLLRDGSRKRRLGLDKIPGTSTLSTGVLSVDFAGANKQYFTWSSPLGTTLSNIGVIRVKNKFWFCDISTEDPLGSFYNSGTPITIPELGNEDVQAASVNGYFVIVSAGLSDVITFSYIPTLNKVIWERTPIMVRDLWGVDDGLNVTTRPLKSSGLDLRHQYNLWNQGWNPNIDTATSGEVSLADPVPRPYKISGVTSSTLSSFINSENQLTQWIPLESRTSVPHTECIEYIATLGFYPSNADIWHVGKIDNISSDFYGTLGRRTFLRNSINNSDAPRGAFIIDAFARGESRRKLLAGSEAVPVDRERGRFSCVESYAGRVFYSGIVSDIYDGDVRSPNYSSYLFFTQVVVNKEKLSACYQEADPSSPEINDLVATDGGTIHLPEVGRIYKIKAALSSLLIFASNGVWELSGNDSGFKATEYQINKVSSIGVPGATSVIEVNGSVIYWSYSGIFALTADSVSGRFRAESISIQAIQTLYTDLSELTIANVVGYFEETENRIRWMYNDSSTYSSDNVRWYNKELVLDLTLKAFYLNTLPTADAKISGYINLDKSITISELETVYAGTEVVQVSLDNVEVTTTIATPRASNVKFLITHGTSCSIGSYSDDSFTDLLSVTGGEDYESYIVTGYDLGQSLSRDKYGSYITIYFNKTESGFDNINLSFINPSSCYLQTRWDFNSSANGNKWGTPYQVYRFKVPYIPADSSDSFDTGEQVVMSKNKIRGSGRALSLRLSSESGKDFHILGWSYDMLVKEAI